MSAIIDEILKLAYMEDAHEVKETEKTAAEAAQTEETNTEEVEKTASEKNELLTAISALTDKLQKVAFDEMGGEEMAAADPMADLAEDGMAGEEVAGEGEMSEEEIAALIAQLEQMAADGTISEDELALLQELKAASGGEMKEAALNAYGAKQFFKQAAAVAYQEEMEKQASGGYTEAEMDKIAAEIGWDVLRKHAEEAEAQEDAKKLARALEILKSAETEHEKQLSPAESQGEIPQKWIGEAEAQTKEEPTEDNPLKADAAKVVKEESSFKAASDNLAKVAELLAGILEKK